MNAPADTIEREVLTTSLDADSSMVAMLNKSEIDQQIATAHRFPRTIKGFRSEVLQLATLNEEVAEECSYALPRDGKTITGPSARFAEILASAYGNCRAGARVVDERGDHVVAQGAFIDLQKNVAITYEVQRRIVDKRGNRYSPDMIGVTANAACSIALRNAILKGVPKALWADLWDQARKVAVGDQTTLANKRAKLIARFAHYGVSEAQVLAKLGRPSLEDVTLADIEILFGYGTALKEGDTTPEALFAPAGSTPVGAAIDKLNDEIKGGEKAKPAAKGKKAPDAEKAKPAADPKAPTFTADDVRAKLDAAANLDDVADARSLIGAVADEAARADLTGLADRRAFELGGDQ